MSAQKDLSKRSLKELIEDSKRYVDSLTLEQKAEMLRKQGESWAKAEANWPKPKYKWVDGVKVYESLEDYYND